MPDRAVHLLAAVTVAGAMIAWPVPVAVGVAVVVAAALARRWPLLVVAGFVLASALGARAEAALAPAPAGPVAGSAIVRTDPIWHRGAVRLDLEIGGVRYEATARGRPAGRLGRVLAGERVVVTGSATPRPPEAPWLVRRGVLGRLVVDEAGPVSGGGWASRLANGIRRTIVAGAEALPARHRALYTGLVFGDDRDQPTEMADDFRRAGLGHLLAVSGQNVAFVLAVVSPLLQRLRPWSRLAAAVAVLGVFATMTRFEPSVLRAVAMAGGAVTATTLGRLASSLRLLSLAVAGLVLVDPLLVRSLGFRLSVAASAGIIVLSRPLAARLPGPRSVAAALSVTGAAQLAVAPLLLAAFGGVPVAALPANLLAVPAAGPAMAWGLTGGLAAGLVGGTAAEWLHLPTRLLLGWIDTVARTSARLPLGELRGAHVAALAVAGAGWGLARSRVVRRVGGAVAVAALVAPALTLRPPSGHVVVSAGAELWRLGGAGGAGVVLIIDGRARADDVLAALRRRGLGRLDLVVAESGSRWVGEVVAAVGRRLQVRVVWAPPRHHVPRGHVPVVGEQVRVGGVVVTVVEVGQRLSVEVGPARGPPPRTRPQGSIDSGAARHAANIPSARSSQAQRSGLASSQMAATMRVAASATGVVWSSTAMRPS